MKCFFLLLTVCYFSVNVFSQNNYVLSDLPAQFEKDKKTIVVNRTSEIQILNQNRLIKKTSETYLVFDKSGLNSLDLSVFYDQLNKIKSVNIQIFDKKGNRVKEIVEKEFRDVSLSDGFSLYSDNRSKYAKIDYDIFPFFLQLDSEVSIDNTLSLPVFYPIQSINDYIFDGSYTITFPKDFGIAAVEKNLDIFNVTVEKGESFFKYTIKNAKAPVLQDLDYSYQKSLPYVQFANSTFGLGRIKGQVTNWNEYGVWYRTNFLDGLDVLPSATILKMKELTQKATSDLEKAQLIFEYVQNNVRYISIQVGIGGWKPFAAKEVDKLKYGDCKALTNYTMALLKCVGVKSYYTIIHASENIIDIDENIISLQGNHVVLSLPIQNELIFLECTNQKIPFGQLSASTDNRKAVMITENGADFVTTNSFNEENSLYKADYIVDLTDDALAKVDAKIVNSGYFYNRKFGLNTNNKDDVNLYLKNKFSSIKGIDFESSEFINDKRNVLYLENIKFSSSLIGSKMGNEFLLSMNPFDVFVRIPQKYNPRISDFQILRALSLETSVTYKLPTNSKIIFLPSNFELTTEFGTYKRIVSKIDDNIMFQESFIGFQNNYSKDKYESYRDFVIKVSQKGAEKLVFTKN